MQSVLLDRRMHSYPPCAYSPRVVNCRKIQIGEAWRRAGLLTDVDRSDVWDSLIVYPNPFTSNFNVDRSKALTTNAVKLNESMAPIVTRILVVSLSVFIGR